MSFEKKEFIYEGKAKKLYKTNDPDCVWIEFKDDLTAFNAVKKGSFEGKGKVNAEISALIFGALKKQGVETHLKEIVTPTDWVTDKVEIIPLEVVVRNKAAGSICKRLGIKEGLDFKKPLFEIFYKKDELSDPFLSFENAEALEVCDFKDYSLIKEKALKINLILKEIFIKAGVDLVDFKIEFGKLKSGEIILADEISPDSCRLWDQKTGKVLDKDRFRKDLGEVSESYHEILNRLKEVLV